jgi:hypothetical protein
MKPRLFDELVADLLKQPVRARRKTLAAQHRAVKRKPKPPICGRPRGIVVTVTIPLHAALTKRMGQS